MMAVISLSVLIYHVTGSKSQVIYMYDNSKFMMSFITRVECKRLVELHIVYSEKIPNL